MKKILSLVLGLLWTLPVWGANCNLFDGTITHWAYTVNPNRVNVSPSYMGITLPVTENKTYTFSRATAVGNRFVRYFTTDVPVEDMAVYDVNPNIPKDTLTHTFTVPAGMKYVVFYFDVSGADISNSKMQLEEGTTATEYTPYNPLCATCDGTVVNYVSATGTVSQSGTPTPTNPIEPVFYQQGDMVLRKVGDVADSYDATTGKITRRVGVKVFNGTENWGSHASNAGWFQLAGDIFPTDVNTDALSTHYMQYSHNPSGMANQDILFGRPDSSTGRVVIRDAINFPDVGLAGDFKSWLAAQYAAGTPVTVWYPLRTETTEDWTETSYCETPIKIATTKYNETKFSPLNTALANAISVVDSVVSNTITQAGRIATLQAQKQTRPADDTCPAYKQCLLVEDEQGVPHWYEITDPFRDFVTPIIANNVAPASTTNSTGYTQLEWLQASGDAYIDTGIKPTSDYEHVVAKFSAEEAFNGYSWRIFGSQQGNCSLVPWPIRDYTNPLGYLAAGGSWYLPRTQDDIISTSLHTPYEMNVIADHGNISGTYCGETFSSTYTGGINQTLTITLFKNNGQNSSGSGGRIYYFKLWTAENVLAFDGIPAKRNSDGAIGMYDTVTKTFFANAGSGTFTAGPTVANTDVPANGTWTATWAADATTGVAAGTITGEGLCNATEESTVGKIATDAQMSSANWNTTGSHCWCKIDSIDIEGSDVNTTTNKWVWITAASGCLSNCSYYCANSTKTAQRFRNIMLNTAQ